MAAQSSRKPRDMTPEATRLARLRMLKVMDTEAEPIFDSLVKLASTVCNTPISLVSLLDGERQWFKANIGLEDTSQTPQEFAFCGHAIEGTGLMEVGDTLQDVRFANNPLVTGAPHIRFYAGVPIVMPGGEAMGTICVIGREPKILDASQRDMLLQLGKAVTEALLLRERAHYPDVSGDQSHYKVIFEKAPVGIFQSDENGSITYTNPRWQEIHGLTYEQSLGRGWRKIIHPQDRARVLSEMKVFSDTGGSVTTNFRLLRGSRELSVHANIRTVTIDASGKRGFIGTVDDISTLRLTEGSLRSTNRFLDRAERISGVGGWESDLRSRSVKWTDQNKRIYGVDASYQPTFDEHIKYFGEKERQLIESTTAQALKTGLPWDLELPMTNAKGQVIWTRRVGEVEFEDGVPVRLVGTLQDITKQKAFENQLVEANSLLRHVVENLPCGLSVFNSDLQLALYNQKFKSLLGLPDSLFDVPVVTFASIIRHNALLGLYGEGSPEQFVESFCELARKPVVHDFQRSGPGGTTLDVRGAPMPGGGFVSTYFDVSAAKAVQASLAQSEERQARAMAASRVALWDLDLRDQSVYMSSTWSELVGGPGGPRTATFKENLALVPEEDRAMVTKAAMAIASGQSDHYSLDHRVKTASGSLIWLHSEGRVTQHDANGRPLRITGTNQDITDRRLAEDRFKNAADMTRATLEATTDGILVVNANREVVLVNQQLLTLWKVPPGTVDGGYAELTSFAMSQVKDPAGFIKKVRELYLQDETESFDLLELLDGRAIERYSKPYSIQGRRTGRVWSFRDVTAQRHAQSELENAKSAAEAANRAKTSFLATMSHEIRTPLNGILGLTRLIQDEALTPRKREFAKLIDDSAQSLLVLVNDFLDLSKIDAGRMTVDNQPFNLHQLITDLAALFGQRASAKSLLFSSDLDAGVPECIWGDGARLRQILSNLLSNALKFTHAGEIGLKVASAHDVHGHLALSFVVSDSGIGIPKQAQEKLFEDYVQADASTTRQYGGTGLGLAIVKQLSGLMGGRVELQSEDGQGSTFTVVLPGVRIAQADEVPGPVESFDPQGLPELRRERLLVVEDNPTNQIVALGLLRKIGYRDVTVVGNGQEAVDEVAKAAFNVILMDCQMPVMDGYTATRALRATGCATPIIAMTANALEGDIQRCLDSGMDAYLSKPLDHVTMLAALVKWRAPAASNSHALESTPSLKPDGESSVATFDASSALERLGGDASLLATVLGSFVERLPAIMQELAHSVEQRDSDSAGRALHSLVGTGDAVSARAISLTVRKMAEFLKTGDWVSLADALLVLKSDFDDFSGEVARSPYRAEPAGHRLS